MVDLIKAMDLGFTITNGPQSMYKLQNGRYLLFCDIDECCDTEMVELEALEFISGDMDWIIVSKKEFF